MNTQITRWIHTAGHLIERDARITGCTGDRYVRSVGDPELKGMQRAVVNIRSEICYRQARARIRGSAKREELNRLDINLSCRCT